MSARPVTPRKPRRARSLFWTIAGVFLLTIVIGTLVQWLVAVAVVGPFEAREAKSRAEELAASVARDIASLDDPTDRRSIREVLLRHRPGPETHPGRALFRGADGRLFTGGPFPGRGRMTRWFGEGLHGPHAPPPDAPDAESARPGFLRGIEVLARREVRRGGERLGEVLVVRVGRPPLGFAGFRSRTALLFLPITVIVSAAAGLVMVRILVRRLRKLETLAARVADGDLSARIEDASGDEIGRVAEGLDRMTTRLAEARTRVQETDAQRRRLLADVTHELATPLTSIRGYAETLLDPAVAKSDEERARYLGGILDESQRMDHLIRDILDLARLEGGVAPLAREPLDWAALCRNTLTRFEPRFHAAGLTVEWRQAADDATIHADGRRMEQVIENLLENEIKYVPSGGRVLVSLAAAPEDGGRLRLEVSDDGPGVPAEDRTRVFERFYRSGGDRTARSGKEDRGSGLGLAIVREIVERHGGVVRAEGRSPQGLTMVVVLPRHGGTD